MAEKSIPKKYMLILQKRYGGQEAIEFLASGDAYVVSIEPFTDNRLVSTTKKNSKIQKNTLAFYDAITNKFESFNHFLSIVVQNIYTLNYKANTSYLGFLNKGYMKKLSLSFNDPVLAQVALVADGNNINKNDNLTMSIITDIVDLIEDEKSDFVNRLQQTFDNKDTRFNFSRSFINNVLTYKAAKRALDNRNRYSHIMSDEIVDDFETFKSEFLTKMQSYKNFRELYRFRKSYLYDKEMEDNIKIVSPEIESSDEQLTENIKDFRKNFEEFRQKSYSKQKIKSDQIPGQLSFFDLPIR